MNKAQEGSLQAILKDLKTLYPEHPSLILRIVKELEILCDRKILKNLPKTQTERTIRGGYQTSDDELSFEEILTDYETKSGFNLTEEQRLVVNSAYALGGISKIKAFAGTGKTFILSRVCEALQTKDFLYVVFNKAMKDEAQDRFPKNTQIKTAHSLAWQAIVARDQAYRKKLAIRNYDYRIWLRENGVETPRLSSEVIMRYAMQTLHNFRVSVDLLVTDRHIDRYDRSEISNLRDLKKVIEITQKLWEAEIDRNAAFPLSHDGYLKLWHMSSPQIRGFDYILLDEAQDADPLILDIIMKQKAYSNIILVGDPYQQIYSWRGAVNSMERVEADRDFVLSTSFRFGDTVARVANQVLKQWKPESLTIKGNPAITDSYLKDPPELDVTYIFRTNAAMLEALLEVKSSFYINASKEELLDECQSILDVYYEVPPKKRKGKKYFKFLTIEELISYGEMIGSVEIIRLGRMAKSSPRKLKTIMAKLVSKDHTPDHPHVILTTAHKAKGLEWDQVVVWDDFPLVDDDPDQNKRLDREDFYLYYVAVTRARKGLHLKGLGAKYFLGENTDQAPKTPELKDIRPCLSLA